MKKEKEADDKLVSKHDQVFKKFFNEKEVAKSFIQEYLPSKKEVILCQQ